MKLLFWPMFLYAFIQSFFFKERKDFWRIKQKGILLGLAMVPIIFYTYNGSIGASPDWLNITIFFISAAIAYIYETKQFRKATPSRRIPKAAFLILCIIALLFVFFTFHPPKINIFRDPITGAYGIQ
jgi:amino acid permease